MKRITLQTAAILLAVLVIPVFATAQHRVFRMGHDRFTMDGKPYQIRSGEIDFQRIPESHWYDRLLKARAMGLNTVATYVFWDRLEPRPDRWNFEGRNNIAEFMKLAQKAGLNVLLRPGPYVCGEWDFGGLPPWLLSTPGITVRDSNPVYLKAVGDYITAIAKQVKSLQNPAGPIIMLQIENEYGSYGNDRHYLEQLAQGWRKAGITVPFYTADGAAKSNLEAGSLPGAAVGLDPATSQKQFDLASKIRPGVPVFCSEYYPGWLTHWGEKWAHVGTPGIIKDIDWFMSRRKSFNLYMVNGGTNFGFYSGANYGKHYEPDVTSYDYDAPINEMGQPTPKYFAIRRAISSALPHPGNLPPVPSSKPPIEIKPIYFSQSASLWSQLPAPVHAAQPHPMETWNQYFGYILYRTRLRGVTSGRLKIIDLHDFATVFLDGRLLGTIDRSKGQDSIDIPVTDDPHPVLDILVEAMGRINFGSRIIDRKGITKRVQLGYMTLMDWQIYNLPMDHAYLGNLAFAKRDSTIRAGSFFRATFKISHPGDTYLDMSKWKKGYVWVNGHNLGRYWDIGPQYRLYCPGSWLHKGKNTIIVFDMLNRTPAVVTGVKKLK